MDFGIGFLTNNVMLPILDFLYGIVPNYGVAIVLLTLIIKGALWPLTAGSIRNMRKMQVVQPEMQRRMKEAQERYKDNPQKLQEETAAIYKEFGNPLAGCLPLLVQMPVLFALFATLRGSPFGDIVHMATVHVKPTTELTQVQPEGTSSPHVVYLSNALKEREQIVFKPNSVNVPVGQTARFEVLQTNGQSFTPPANLKPIFEIVSGNDKATINPDTGVLQAIATGDAQVHVTVPGVAAKSSFLFIEQIGRSGINSKDGIHWDNLLMTILFGVTLYFSQTLTSKNNPNMTEQQKQINKLTPFIFSGMFVFFPLPAGVLLYILLSNLFQIVQTLILYREPLPENIQRLLDQQKRKEEGEKPLPFESKPRRKKKA
jgi:YidC/Oxa1 family membrane protein insertase